MKIFLVGMPGSGKSTLGRQIADRLSFAFYDLDHEIETAERKSIAEIFNHSGEDYFRIRESELLREFCARDESFVLATGGGAPCFFDNISTLNKTGLTVFIDVPVETLLERTSGNDKRPLLNDAATRKERLVHLLELRQDCYRQAKLIVRNPTAESLTQALFRAGVSR